jgi:hypothetical protein
MRDNGNRDRLRAPVLSVPKHELGGEALNLNPVLLISAIFEQAMMNFGRAARTMWRN